ncbi:MAG TPA: right-handed parallel beta-helix repeat-containing protein [Anaeromyxobacter sp.]|nr:right-handed parallel beta-helix repeat-containing protein [Anaeromyxobacter sp.]
MRALLALAAALLATGCSVPLEGAACTAPGEAASCPSGQACGIDLRCSTGAAQCAAMCIPGDPGSAPRCSSDGKGIERCTSADPVCGAWQVAAADDCDAQQLVCAGGAAPACQCKPAGPVFVADAAGGATSASLAPSGAGAPVACRFRSLGAALAAAGAYATANGSATVSIQGGKGTFGKTATGESFPLTVPAGVTLTGSESPLDPTQHVILVDDSGAATAVQLGDGARLAGVAIQDQDATGTGVAVSCAAQAVSLDTVTVEAVALAPATGVLATGISIGGACEVDLTGVTVQGASGIGIDVNRSAPTALVATTGLVLDQNGTGLRLEEGNVTLGGATVKRSVGTGVDATTSTSGNPSLTIQGGAFHHNGDTAVALQGNALVAITGAQICQNGAVRTWGPGTARKVGGVVGIGFAPSTFAFTGNLVHDNAGDQVLIAASGASTWALDGVVSGVANCTAGAMNVFSGYASGTYGLVANGAKVSATFDLWSGGNLPASNQDYQTYNGGTVNAVGTSGNDYCLMPPTLSCPPAQ